MSTRLSTEELAAKRDELLAALHDYALLGGPEARANGWRWADCDLLLAAEAEIRSLVSESGRARRALRDLVDSCCEVIPDEQLAAARAVLSENPE